MSKPARVILLIAIVLCVAFRTAHSGWGLIGPVPASDESVRFGIATNPGDYLTYSSWAQQSKAGSWNCSDLYTTTPHAAVYFNPFFLIVGWLSRIFSVSPELILNLSVFLSLFIFVAAFDWLCRRLRFGNVATICAFCFCLGGGGVAWLRRGVELLGLEHVLRSVGPDTDLYHIPDWFYAELFPLVSFNVSPFHSMSLALFALLVALLIRYDRPDEPFSWRGACLLIGAATFLVGLRPYEPVVLLAAAGTYFAGSVLFRASTGEVKRRGVLFACLCLGILPFLVYDSWLTRQPVWRDFSHKGLYLFAGSDWAGAFLVLWILAIAGITVLGARALRAPYALLVIWFSIYAAILIVLQSGLTKLCGGCTIPLALLAGVAIEHGGRRLGFRRHPVLASAALGCLALASATVLLGRVAASPPPRVPADLLAAIKAIRHDSSTPAPAVLTDPATALFLPGLGGLRVYCGNWGLTDDYPAKVAALATMGLGVAPPDEQPSAPAGPDEPDPRRAAREALHQQIQSGVFSYLLIDKRDAGHALTKTLDDASRSFPQSVVHNGSAFCVIKLNHDTIAALPGLTSPTPQ
jgi:hypothetical protein